MWWTLFHEIAHLLNHSKKHFYINYEKDPEEDEADEIASNYLISEKLYKKFIEGYNYSIKDEIVSYSERIGIAPCILVGRLQHDNLINYVNYNHSIPSFERASY